MRYSVNVHDFAPQAARHSGPVAYVRNLSLAKAHALCIRHARRGFRLFGRIGSHSAALSAEALRLAGEARRAGDMEGARQCVRVASSIRRNPHSLSAAGAVRRHNWGVDGGRFAEAYRSATIKLDRFC